MMVWLCSGLGMIGQGLVEVANVGAALNSPFFDVDGVTRLNGVRWYEEFLAGPDPSSLSPVGPTFTAQFINGYFNAGAINVTNITGPDGFGAVRVWDQRAASFAEAQALGIPHGETTVFPFIVAGPLQPAASLVNMPSLTLVVPEPSVIAFAIVGAAALVFFRRAGQTLGSQSHREQ